MTDLRHDIRFSRRCPHLHRRRGFTLIELVTVVVIIAILTAIALPSLAQSDDLTADSAARVVLGDLLYAQSQAIATGQTQYVSFNLNGAGGYSLYADQSLATPITNPTTLGNYTTALGTGSMTGVTLSGLSLDSATNTVLAFDSLGCPMVCTTATTATPVALANTGSVTLTCGACHVTLSIEPDTGSITVSQ